MATEADPLDTITAFVRAAAERLRESGAAGDLTFSTGDVTFSSGGAGLDAVDLLEVVERCRAAEARIRLARDALREDPYYAHCAVGDDIAPRIMELAADYRRRIGDLEPGALRSSRYLADMSDGEVMMFCVQHPDPPLVVVAAPVHEHQAEIAQAVQAHEREFHGEDRVA